MIDWQAMEDCTKFSENVMLIDVAFLNEIVRNVKDVLGTRLGRELPPVDLPAWLSYLALDAGLRAGDNKMEVIWVRDRDSHVLDACEPSDLERLDRMACRTPLGEFRFSSASSSGMVSTGELYLDLMDFALDDVGVKCLVLLPFHPAYGDKVEEKLGKSFKDKPEEERSKAVYFTLKEPLRPVHCQHEPVFYSLAHAFGVNPDEL